MAIIRPEEVERMTLPQLEEEWRKRIERLFELHAQVDEEDAAFEVVIQELVRRNDAWKRRAS